MAEAARHESKVRPRLARGLLLPVLLTLLAACGGGGSQSGRAATAAAAVPLTLVSRGLPVQASSASAPAANAVDADYNTLWRSQGVPARLAFDLSGIAAGTRHDLLLVWYNEATYAYDHALAGYPGYDNPGSYTVEGNAAAGGGAAPGSGWVVLAQVSGNTRHSREHRLDLAAYSWLRLNFSASDGSPGATEIAINVDLYAVPGAVVDGWLFAGDSITADCMGHGDLTTLPAPAFGSRVSNANPPPQENAGMPAWTSGDLAAQLDGWLATFPGRYVTLDFGTNDAVNGVSDSQFAANMAQLVQRVLDAGKQPVLPTIPYSSGPAQARIGTLNARIRELYAAYPALLPGPDLYAYYQAHPELLAADGVHLSDAGCAAYRQVWADRARSAVY